MEKRCNIETMTIEDFTQLIASGDDNYDNQIRVSKDGMVYLSQNVVGANNLEGVAFRLESFDAGNDYVGVEASKDEQHVTNMYKAIKANWEKGCLKTHIDDWNIR